MIRGGNSDGEEPGNQQDSSERGQNLRKIYEKEAREVVRNLKMKSEEDRSYLAQCYRKLNSMIDKSYSNNFYLTQDKNMIQKVTNYAFFVEPSNFDTPHFQDMIFQSINCKESYIGNRHCLMPVISIDGEQVNFQGKNQKIIAKEKQFLLTIDSEPNSYIIYTTKSTHPLLNHQKMAYEKAVQHFSPPCELNIVISKDPFKLESHMATLRIKFNKTTSSGHQMGGISMGAQRPMVSFSFDESSSMHGNAESYYAIEKQSESR